MKKMTLKMEKVLKSVLLLAMVAVLGWCLPQMGFAADPAPNSYYGFTITVEHKWEDSSNGQKLDKNQYPEHYDPRDKLIDALGEGGLKVEITDKDGKPTQANGKDIADVKTDGTETGDNAAKQDIASLIDRFIGIPDSEEGEIDRTNCMNAIKKYVDGLNAEDRKTKPTAPSVEEPVYQYNLPEKTKEELEQAKADAEQAQKDNPQPMWKGHEDEYESYEKYLEEHEKWAAEEKERQETISESKSYLEQWTKYEAWKEENKDALGEWEKYDNDKAAYETWLTGISKDLKDWMGSGSDNIEMYDKNLDASYEKTYNELLKELVNPEKSMSDIYEELTDSQDVIINENTWVSNVDNYEGEVDLDAYLAELNKDDKDILEGPEFSHGHYETVNKRITVVRAVYDLNDGEIVRDDWGRAVANERKTYYSDDNGETWKEVDGDGTEFTTAQIQKDLGRVEAFTFTFTHQWNPNVDRDDFEVTSKWKVPEPETTNPPENPPENPSTPPSTPPEEPETEIPESNPPQAEPEKEPEVEIPEEDVPLTGDLSYTWYAAALFAAAGLLVLVIEDRRSKKNA